MSYSDYKKQRIIHWYTKGLKAPSIRNKLVGEGLPATRQGIHKFIRKLEETGTVARKQGSGRPSKVAGEVERFIEDAMNKDDETTVKQLQKLLQNEGYHLSRTTILCCRKNLGWSTRGAAYTVR